MTASKIEEFLYLGNEEDTLSKEYLKSLGITHVLNMAIGLSFPFKHDNYFTYLCLPCEDSMNFKIMEYFERAICFIGTV